MTDELTLEYVEIALIDPDESNPNEMDDRTFNALCAAIQEEGFVEPVQLVPTDGRYVTVGGHHRVMAAQVLGMEKVPAVLLDPEKFDEDRRKWNLVKLNILRGKLNPEKFATLYEEMSRRYDGEVLQALMGFTSDDAFRKVYRDVRAALPKELQDALDEVKDEIRTIDDLSLVLNRLFGQYGETLPSNMMVFSWAGKDVMWIRADDELWEVVTRIAKTTVEEQGDVAAVMRVLLLSGLKSSENVLHDTE